MCPAPVGLGLPRRDKAELLIPKEDEPHVSCGSAMRSTRPTFPPNNSVIAAAFWRAAFTASRRVLARRSWYSDDSKE